MAASLRVASSVSATASNYASYRNAGASAADIGIPEQFPAGLRVLVVDDDTTCLSIIERMLRRCHYHVTTSNKATVALNILRERKGCFDVVLSDVHMPDMDGYKLLEYVGLEMDLPVIMMSADGRTSAVMKGIRHGACDYLIKPIREEELKNIWQHVVRKKWHENKEFDHSGSLDESERNKQGNDDTEYASSFNEATEGALKSQKKRSITKDGDDGEPESDDPSTSKKPRVVWSVDLHQQFVNAVNHLGIDKAVPKRILELMNVSGLTRENVASHLQKFRLYLKRLSGVAQQGGMPNSFCGPLDSNIKLNSVGRFDLQALVASGQIPPQTLAILQAELLGRQTSGLVTTMDQPALLQASIQGSKCIPIERGLAYGQPLPKNQPNVSKHFPSNVTVEDASLAFGSWPSTTLGTVGSNANLGGTNTQSGNVLVDILQQHHQPQRQSLSDLSRSVNVQPSCLVAPSQSSAGFQSGNRPSSLSQNCNFDGNSIIDYGLLSSQANTSALNIGHISDGDIKSSGVLSGYSAPGSLSPTSSCSVNVDSAITGPVQNSTIPFGAATRQISALPPNICDVQGLYGDQGSLGNPGFANKGTAIPTRFAVDEFEAPVTNFSHGKFYAENNGNKVKLEPNMEFTETLRVGIPVVQQFPPNDLMSVFTN